MTGTAKIITFPVRARRLTPEEVMARRERRRANDRRRRGTPEERAAKKEARKARSLKWYHAFGERLRVVRLALGMTDVEAASIGLITLRTYRKMEAGLPFHRWDHGFLCLSEEYDVSLRWLLAGIGDMWTKHSSQHRKPSLKLVPNDKSA